MLRVVRALYKTLAQYALILVVSAPFAVMGEERGADSVPIALPTVADNISADLSTILAVSAESVDSADNIVDTTTAASATQADTAASISAVDTALSELAVSAAETAPPAMVDSVMPIRPAVDTMPAVLEALEDVSAQPAAPASPNDIHDSFGAFNLLFFCASLAIIIAAIFFFLTRRKRSTRRFLTTMRLSVLDRTVQKGCRYIESNYADPNLSIGRVCSELVTGEAYLDALFVKEIGVNVHDFIAQVRVNCIKHILTTDGIASQDIAKVCAQCGFTDMAEAEKHFVRVFKMSIKEYLGSL